MILISNSYNINKFGVGIFTRQGHIKRVYYNSSESVSQLVSDKGKQRSDSGPIKIIAKTKVLDCNVYNSRS